MKILLTGKNGQVGFELQRSLALLGDVVAVDQSDCDISDSGAIRRLVDNVQPNVIVNSAAYTAVDKAQSDEFMAHSVNAVAPGILGEVAREIGAVVVHYSTDYVFDGNSSGAYSENDVPNPQNIYGRTKLAGELALQMSRADCLIFRTSWVFGAHGNNFAKTILRLASERDTLKIVSDQIGAPTSAALLADSTALVLARLFREGKANFPFGLYHLTAGGFTSWHAYAQKVVSTAEASGKRFNISASDIEAIPSSAYHLAAPRPANSRLNTEKFKQTFGMRLPAWEDGLAHVLQEIL